MELEKSQTPVSTKERGLDEVIQSVASGSSDLDLTCLTVQKAADDGMEISEQPQISLSADQTGEMQEKGEGDGRPIQMDNSNQEVKSEVKTPTVSTCTSYAPPPPMDVKMEVDEEEPKDSNTTNDQVKEEPQSTVCLCGSSHTSLLMIQCEHCDIWFHSDCVEITKTVANSVKSYYCPPCIRKDSNLKIIYKKKKEELRCGKCIGCFRPKDCTQCKGCQKGEECVKRRCVQADLLRAQKEKKGSGSRVTNSSSRKREPTANVEQEDVKPPPMVVATVPAIPPVSAEKKKRGRRKGTKKEEDDDEDYMQDKGDAIALRNRMLSEAYDSYARRTTKATVGRKRTPSPVQCIGPECVLSARSNSKYCSDECGMRLAESRINSILPDRVRDYWGTLPIAYKRAIEQGNKVDMQITECSLANEKLLERMHRVHKWVEALKSIEPLDCDNDEEGDNVDAVVSCPVCTVEHSAKGLAKHVERCFVRAEKQITFGTSYKMANNVGNLFCDNHNKATDTYCKRLRVMCAEHYKGELENEMKICGFPTAWTDLAGSKTFAHAFALFDDMDTMTRSFCQLPRKECLGHHRWIQTSLGVLECERMNVLTRLDELFERRRTIVASLQTRGDLISLMCNKTTVAPSTLESTTTVSNV